MRDESFLDWPFSEAGNRAFAAEVEAWATEHADRLTDHDADGSTRALAVAMGEAALLRVAVPDDRRLDVRDRM